MVGTVYAPDTVTGLDQVFDSRNAGARTLTVSAYTVNDGNGGAQLQRDDEHRERVRSARPTLTINATTGQPRLRRHNRLSSDTDRGGHGVRRQTR